MVSIFVFYFDLNSYDFIECPLKSIEEFGQNSMFEVLVPYIMFRLAKCFLLFWTTYEAWVHVHCTLNFDLFTAASVFTLILVM